MREKGGRTKASVIVDAGANSIHRAVHSGVETGSTLHTDEHGGYVGKAVTMIVSQVYNSHQLRKERGERGQQITTDELAAVIRRGAEIKRGGVA